MAAGRQLNNAVLAYGAEPGDLKPYMGDIIQQLIFVIEEVELTETKNMLLHTMSSIVERMEELVSQAICPQNGNNGDQITPYAEAIITLLPRLWDQSGDQHLTKQTVLVVLYRLFRAMGEAGAAYHSLTLPLIYDIVKPESTLGYVLLEETLELWCTVVQETPTQAQQDLNADLLGLMQYLPPLLEQDTENTEKCIDIVESYTVLAPRAMLSRDVFPKILAAFNTKLGNMNPCHSAYVTNAVEVAWCAGVALEGPQAVEEILFQLLSSGFLDGIVTGLKESWEAHQTTGPKAKHTSIQGLIETDYFAVLSRIAFESPEHFVQALEKCEAASVPPKKMTSSGNLTGVDLAMEWILDEWLTHVEDLSDPERRKLMNLAITQLLRLRQPFLLNRMQRLFSLWTSSIIELTEGLDDRTADVFMLAAPEPPPGVEAAVATLNPHERRKQEMRLFDPIVKVNLIALVKARFGEYVQRVGGEGRFREEVLVNMDRQVVDDFLALGIM